MLFNRLYYQVKPFVPWRLRLAGRRARAAKQRERFAGVWPINPAAAAVPKNWPGWPGGKKFALVLTHDVEGTRGLDHSRALAEFEISLGIRSAFNFVPQGEYRVSEELRRFLTDNNFEVGVHDLRHDGKLYWSRSAFKRNAENINQYLKAWGAVGFRSGFMHHNLEWLHQLNVLYDSSTFDTDPFEPQPDAVDTIFPFWVPRPGATPDSHPSAAGYIELPYTLPQDFTLFLIFQEPNSETWKRKLDWIVEHGGMALVDVHPDYVDFGLNGRGSLTYPVDRYREFIEYVQHRYAGSYWHALPREVAEFSQKVFCPALKEQAR